MGWAEDGDVGRLLAGDRDIVGPGTVNGMQPAVMEELRVQVEREAIYWERG